MQYDCIKIFFTGENIGPDWNIADYSIDFDCLNYGDRHLRTVLMNPLQMTFTKNMGTEDVKDKFCCIVVTNPGSPDRNPRELFLDKLNSYKRVDSGGRWKNNIGGPIGDRYGDFQKSKIEWLKQYKFNMCFENSSSPGYLTEKLFDAFEAGCIPIYWGDTSLRCGLGLKDGKFGEIDSRIPKIDESLIEFKINPKAFINAHNYETWDELLEEIKRIDNDDEAYKAMLAEPVFLGDFDFAEYDKRVERFLCSIFDQEPKLASRVSKSSRIVKYANKRKHSISIEHTRDLIYAFKILINDRISKIRKHIYTK